MLALTPSPSPSRGEGRIGIKMQAVPPLPLRERGLGGEGQAATTENAPALPEICVICGYMLLLRYN